MLYKVERKNKYGTTVTRIIYSKEPLKSTNNLIISRFKYKYAHPILPPTLTVDLNGKQYITPTWKPVLPQTTLDDIEWEKPKQVKIENIWEFPSSNGKQTYIVQKLPDGKLRCSCMGFWRSSGNCKHVKQINKQLCNT